jgi:hypothetical protein
MFGRRGQPAGTDDRFERNRQPPALSWQLSDQSKRPLASESLTNLSNCFRWLSSITRGDRNFIMRADERVPFG